MDLTTLALIAAIVGVSIALYAIHFSRRSTQIAEREQAARIAKDRAIQQAPPEGGDYPNSVFGAVSLSLERLTPASARIANILAFWAPEGLQSAIFNDVVAASEIPENREILAPIPDDLWSTLWAEGAVVRLCRIGPALDPGAARRRQGGAFRLAPPDRSGDTSPAALKEILDLMGLTMDDALRILPEYFQPPDHT